MARVNSLKSVIEKEYARKMKINGEWAEDLMEKLNLREFEELLEECVVYNSFCDGIREVRTIPFSEMQPDNT